MLREEGGEVVLLGATVLLTGALGFLGKVVLERLLASSKPARILLLLRPKHGYSAQQRLNHAKTRPCFAHLPPSAWDIVVALEGDTESPGLGLSAAAAAAAAATLSYGLPWFRLPGAARYPSSSGGWRCSTLSC